MRFHQGSLKIETIDMTKGPFTGWVVEATYPIFIGGLGQWKTYRFLYDTKKEAERKARAERVAHPNGRFFVMPNYDWDEW